MWEISLNNVSDFLDAVAPIRFIKWSSNPIQPYKNYTFQRVIVPEVARNNVESRIFSILPHPCPYFSVKLIRLVDQSISRILGSKNVSRKSSSFRRTWTIWGNYFLRLEFGGENQNFEENTYVMRQRMLRSIRICLLESQNRLKCVSYKFQFKKSTSIFFTHFTSYV